MEDPDDHEENDDDNTNDIEALGADPLVKALQLAVIVVETLVNALVFLVTVEECPDEEDSGGNDEDGVESDCICVEADAAETFAQGAPEARITQKA